MGKGERYFPVAGRRTDSPRDILRTPTDISTTFRCVLTRPVVDCHHSQITIVIIDGHEKVFRVSFLGCPFLHEKIYQLIPFRISDIMDDEAKKKEICTNLMNES